MDQTESYVQNQMIECSRLSSVEHKSGNDTNNAIFTNKIGSGIQLNVGDTVSCHAAMISEVGAGSETIELKGKSLGVKQKYKYTKKTPIKRDTYTASNNLDGLDAEYINVVEEEIELKDNEANLLISYYKTLNGENCFSLPRRFSFNNIHQQTFYEPDGVGMYEANDNPEEGSIINQIHNGTFIAEDYYQDRNASAVWNKDPRANRALWKIRQDGLKYTIFARETTYFNQGAEDYLDIEIPTGTNGSADPALDNYNRYVELKKITIPPGRRSADFIAESVTRQLQKGSDIRKIYHHIDDTNPDTAEKTPNQGVVAGVYETDTFKLFTAHNGSTFSENNYNRIKINGTQIEQKKLDWYAGFQYVAFKRPDFVEAGRATRPLDEGRNPANSRITHITSNDIADRKTSKIEINLDYNETNCSLMSQFLKSQELYPEMWNIVENASSHYYSQYTQEYYDEYVPDSNKVVLSSDNSRVLHLDMVQLYDSSTYQRDTFGSDMLNPTANSFNSIPSQPIFVVYDKTTEDKFYENPEYDYPRTIKLSYGAFTKGPNNKIQFQFEGIGGIPNIYYNASGYFIGNASTPDYDGSHSRRFMGYDFHFTAYGNAAVGLYNDMLVDRNNTTLSLLRREEENGNYKSTGVEATLYQQYYNQMNKYYMGANNPKLVYDNIKDRFGFQNFYTAERKGNRDSAAATTTLGSVDGSPEVYKINKRLRRQNYSPGMIPYSREINACISVNGSQPSITFDLPNKAIYPFSVMDSHSGIFINSFGYNKDNWNDGLFKILGFSYEQLQAKLTKNNTPQIRINTDNIDTLHQVTTEADVVAQDVLLYDQNPFGATMFHPVIRPVQLLWLNKSGLANPYSNLPWYPEISVGSLSNIITAEAVPKQMLRPFYCLRSSLLDDISAYYGSDDSGILLPTMAIVTKSTDSGDFFVGGDDSVTFTVTKPKVVTSITTAITDPDGSFSRVDDNSAVIYKISKNKSYPVDLLSTMFKKK
jgi:hypothetical protein